MGNHWTPLEVNLIIGAIFSGLTTLVTSGIAAYASMKNRLQSKEIIKKTEEVKELTNGNLERLHKKADLLQLELIEAQEFIRKQSKLIGKMSEYLEPQLLVILRQEAELPISRETDQVVTRRDVKS